MGDESFSIFVVSILKNTSRMIRATLKDFLCLVALCTNMTHTRFGFYEHFIGYKCLHDCNWKAVPYACA
jgi:hypothetical protein